MRVHRSKHALVLFARRWSLGLIDHRVHRPLFSERYRLGGARYLHIGPWCVRFRRYAGTHPTPSPGTPAPAGHDRKA